MSEKYDEGGATMLMSALQEELLRGYGDFVEQLRQAWNVPGVAVAVVKGEEVLLAEGFGTLGIAGEAAQLPVTADTVFPIGSLTKPFTTLLVSLLASEGRLDWDAPVKAYLPDFALMDELAGERVTLRDLACHRTGLPLHSMLPAGAEHMPRAELVQRMRYLEPSREFRTVFQYAGLNYVTLARVIEAVTGQTWEKVLQERILEPYGLTATYSALEEAEAQAPMLARPHVEVDDLLVEAPGVYLNAQRPAGGINASVSDLARFLQLQIQGGGAVDAGMLQRMHAPQIICPPQPMAGVEMPVQTYGLGWFVEWYRGHKMVHHGGNIGGFTALGAFLPNQQVGVVVLTNKTRVLLPMAAVYRVFDLALELEPVDWQGRFMALLERVRVSRQQQAEQTAGLRAAHAEAPMTQPPLPLAAYAGSYEHPGYGRIEAFVEGDELVMQYHAFRFTMKHSAEHTFDGTFTYVRNDTVIPFTFDVEEDGTVISMTAPMEEPPVNPVVFTKWTENSSDC